jgi:uracil phosphoribosyltransferase
VVSFIRGTRLFIDSYSQLTEKISIGIVGVRRA